ncbi:MAG: molybdopterin molybdotransferase MoeA [Pseudomonadota bacterium]
MSTLISYEEALGLIMDHAPARHTEAVPLVQAAGRSLARPIRAEIARPLAALSAMDGYAVRLADVQDAGRQLEVIGEAPAGHVFDRRVGEGEAVRIFTGGVLPHGADHVIIQEEALRDGDQITTNRAYSDPEYVRPAGLDFEKGDLLLEQGERLGAASIGLLAAGNIADVDVMLKPRVGILSNGDELKTAGSDLAPGEIPDANLPALSAAIRDWGGEPVDLGRAGDSASAIQDRIVASQDIDIFLPIGGASVGDHDLMRPAFKTLGFEPVFERVAVRPGKPTWLSKKRESLVLGLPGNPASAFVCARLFLRPLLTGQPNAMLPAATETPMPENGPRAHFMRAAVSVSDDGRLVANVAGNQDSSLIRPLVQSNALLYRAPHAPALDTGEPAPIIVTGELK